MRIVVPIVEAVLALGVGGGAGVGYLYASDTLLSPSRIQAIEKEIEADEARVAARAEAERAAKLAREKAETERLMAEKAAAEQRAKDEEAKKKAAEAAAAASRGPAFGVLNIKTLADSLEVDGGPGLKGSGKSIDLKFEEKPGRITVKSGRFTILLDPRPAGKTLGMGVTVKPLAIVVANDIAKGTSANDLEIDKTPFKLDFRSPGQPVFNLILSYRK